MSPLKHMFDLWGEKQEENAHGSLTQPERSGRLSAGWSVLRGSKHHRAWHSLPKSLPLRVDASH